MESETKLNMLIHRKFRLWGLLLCGSILYFFANVQRVAIPGSIFDDLQRSLHLSAVYITNLGAAFMYVYALNQLLIGLLVDRFGGCRVIAWGALLFCVGSAMFPFADTLFLLYFSRAVVPYQRNTPPEDWLKHHTYYKHIGLYAYRAEVLREITSLPQSPLELAESLEQLRWLENGYAIKVGVTHQETIGIDTPQDLERAERFLQSMSSRQ